MDNHSASSERPGGSDTLRNLFFAGAVFVTILYFGPMFFPSAPAPDSSGETPTQQVDRSSADDVAASDNTGAPATSKPSESASTQEQSTAELAALEAEEETSVAIGSPPDDQLDEDHPDPYRMRLVISNVGASVASATMTDHALRVGSQERYQLLRPVELDDGRRLQSLAVDRINVDGKDLILSDKKWKFREWSTDGSPSLFQQTEDSFVAELFIDITRHGERALRLTRRFELPRQDAASGRHDMAVSLSVANVSANDTLPVIVTYRGGVGVPAVATGRNLSAVDFGVRSASTGILAQRREFAKIGKEKEVTLYKRQAESSEQFSWAATGTTYFTCTLAPLSPDGKEESDDVSKVTALDADGNPATEDDISLVFVMDPASVAPGSSLTYPIDVYLGEKGFKAFKNVRAYVSRDYYAQISQGYGSCTFTWLVELMIWLLNTLHYVVGDFGVAIIILVLIVRTMLHPITKKGQVNMVRMQQKMGEFAPKLEELKQKYANDKARLQQETMKLYREGGINPASQILTCLPMMLQMPIWVALFISLSNNVQMRHEGLLYGWTWVTDLTAQDALYRFDTPFVVPIFGFELPSFNLLPILLGIAMFMQQKLQPKPKPNPNASDQQRQQQEMMQKMMPMMSIMMLFFFYKMPSGLNLYIMASSFFGTYEQFRIRKHIKEQEAAGTFDKPKPAAKSSGAPAKRHKPSFFQKLQSMAEEAQKKQHSPRGKRKKT